MHDKGQIGREKIKGVPPDVIVTSNSKEDNITKIKGTMINSNMRAYYEKGRSGKHAIWLFKGLNVSMYLKHGLQGIVKVDVRMRPNKDKLGLTEEGRLKCLVHEDD